MLGPMLACNAALTLHQEVTAVIQLSVSGFLFISFYQP